MSRRGIPRFALRNGKIVSMVTNQPSPRRPIGRPSKGPRFPARTAFPAEHKDVFEARKAALGFKTDADYLAALIAADLRIDELTHGQLELGLANTEDREDPPLGMSA